MNRKGSVGPNPVPKTAIVAGPRGSGSQAWEQIRLSDLNKAVAGGAELAMGEHLEAVQLRTADGPGVITTQHGLFSNEKAGPRLIEMRLRLEF